MARDSYHVNLPNQHRLPFACQDVPRSCNIPQTIIDDLARQFLSKAPFRPLFASMAIPSETAVRSIISLTVPHVAIDQVGILPSVKLQRLYGIKLSDETSLVLALSPPPMVKLLRFEQLSTSSEAVVLKFLAEYGAASPSTARSCQATRPAENTDATIPDPKCRASTTPEPEKGPGNYLSRFVPTLVSQPPVANVPGKEYNIIRPTSGAPIVVLMPPLVATERKSVDWQVGNLCRCISDVTAPSGKFGPALAVLSTSIPKNAPLGSAHTKGFCTWSEAFHSQLENILRDGEDMAVTLGYSTIRGHFRRFRHLLDDVKTPRLVVVDAWDDANILIHRPSPSDAANERNAKENRPKGCSKKAIRQDDGISGRSNDSRAIISDETGGVHVAQLGSGRCHSDGVYVTGLRDWSNCVFGDPLFTSAFSQEATDNFLLGFNAKPGEMYDEQDDEDMDEAVEEDVIENRARADVRLLLYKCYHAAVGVVKEFYRPSRDGSSRELAARKMLNEALTRLSERDNEGTQRRRRPSGEMSPAKRLKHESEEED
jgi:hypothetical protein